MFLLAPSPSEYFSFKYFQEPSIIFLDANLYNTDYSLFTYLFYDLSGILLI